MDKERLSSDAMVLKGLKASQEWDTYNFYIERMGEDYLSGLINGISDGIDLLRYKQGVMAGLRMAQQVPDNVLLWAKQTLDSKTRAM